MRRWTQSTNAFFYTQKQDGYQEGDRWQEFLNCKSHCRDCSQKKVTTCSSFQWQGVGQKTCLLVRHIQSAQWTQSVTSGKMTTVFKLADKVAAFKVKLQMWGWSGQRDIWHVSNISKDFGRDWAWAFSFPAGEGSPVFAFKGVQAFLLKQQRHANCEGMIRDPFLNKLSESSLSVREEDQLLEITNDGGLKSIFDTTTMLVFWIKIKAEYPEISTKSLKTQLPFPTSYLCEAGFSAMTEIKTKSQNKLDIRNRLQVSLSPVTPRWDRLVAQKQAQGSHWYALR